ncbi:hypothetical protein ACJJTC_019209 [Scirpophaga incertulas]
MSGNPAYARRHLPGRDGVKCATGHASAARQAMHGNSATDESNTYTSIRHPHLIGTWNVRGLNQPGKLGIVENEMRRKKVHLLGLSETHWKGQGHFTSELGNTVYFSGPEGDSSRGVAFIVPQSLNKCVVGYNPVSDHDNHLRRIVGKYGIGERNDRGERLMQFCYEENFTIMNTCFKHHIRRLYTWISPGDRCRNQIDYILIGTRWKSSVTNTKTLPGADCGSDHQLLVATVQLRLKRIQKPEGLQT